jgi:hypothetical protein
MASLIIYLAVVISNFVSPTVDSSTNNVRPITTAEGPR